MSLGGRVFTLVKFSEAVFKPSAARAFLTVESALLAGRQVWLVCRIPAFSTTDADSANDLGLDGSQSNLPRFMDGLEAHYSHGL